MNNLHKPYGPYERWFKRFLDIVLCLIALIVLSPLLLLLTITGAAAMKGNPFFVQKRPGKIEKESGKEKIFHMIKFRTMTNVRDENGKLLPDRERLNRYGRFLRVTSLDELPELINIVIGDMSIVGPRPLAVVYLPYYTPEERNRHDIRPGLTGLAQINGRNMLSWEQKFSLDLEYVSRVTFFGDVKIILQTVRKVLVHDGIKQEGDALVSLHIQRKDWKEHNENEVF